MNADAQKRAAAARAVEFVRPGMRLGLGTGSTAKHFVELVGERVRAGLDVIAVPTSQATRADAERCGIALTTLDETPELDLTVDGADEIAPDLSLIKGGGGALLREKIVAAASARMVVIADRSKWVGTLGRFPLPIEVAPFGLGATLQGDRKGHCGDPAARTAERCGRARTAMLSSRMAVTGSSTPRWAGLTIRKRWRMRFRAFPGSWSMACSSASRRRPFWPDRTA